MIRKILISLYSYMLFFLLVGIIIGGNVALFLHILKIETGIVYTQHNIRFATIFAFYNTAFIAGIVSFVNQFRRKVFVEKPLNEILEVTKRITHGDFSARVKEKKFGYFSKMAIDINVMAEELSNIETLKVDFISNVSHELKTPLAVLQNYSSLLEKVDLPEEKRISYAKAMQKTTSHLSELITNILKLNKLESQNISPALKKCNISENLCECLLDFESEWNKKNINLDINIEEDVYINTEPDLISIVWTNLFSNAIKFSSDSGTISVSLNDVGSNIVVSISDTGCGMDKKTINHIFDKFYQGDTSHSVEGNGLGLALVKQVVDILGGEIDVESMPGEGSTFTVTLPCQPEK